MKKKTHLHVGDRHTEEQVHDDDGDDEDEDGEDEVGSDGEELLEVLLLQCRVVADKVWRGGGAGGVAGGGRGVQESDVLLLRVVQVVVLNLAGHHHHHLKMNKNKTDAPLRTVIQNVYR